MYTLQYVPRAFFLFTNFSYIPEHTLRGWSKLTFIVNALLGPPILIYTIDAIFKLGLGFDFELEFFIVYGIGLALSISLIIYTLVRLHSSKVPRLICIFAFFGFSTSLCYIYLGYWLLLEFFPSMFVGVFDKREALMLVFVPMGNALPGELLKTKKL